jgi:hypothetical protein
LEKRRAWLDTLKKDAARPLRRSLEHHGKGISHRSMASL